MDKTRGRSLNDEARKKSAAIEPFDRDLKPCALMFSAPLEKSRGRSATVPTAGGPGKENVEGPYATRTFVVWNDITNPKGEATTFTFPNIDSMPGNHSAQASAFAESSPRTWALTWLDL